jgi:hypothetical protein
MPKGKHILTILFNKIFLSSLLLTSLIGGNTFIIAGHPSFGGGEYHVYPVPGETGRDPFPQYREESESSPSWWNNFSRKN